MSDALEQMRLERDEARAAYEDLAAVAVAYLGKMNTGLCIAGFPTPIPEYAALHREVTGVEPPSSMADLVSMATGRG